MNPWKYSVLIYEAPFRRIFFSSFTGLEYNPSYSLVRFRVNYIQYFDNLKMYFDRRPHLIHEKFC